MRQLEELERRLLRLLDNRVMDELTRLQATEFTTLDPLEVLEMLRPVRRLQ